QHLLYFKFQAEPCALEIDINRPVPVFFALFNDRRPITFDAGGVEGTVQSAESPYRLLDQRLDVDQPRDIGLDEQSVATSTPDQIDSFVPFIFPAPGDHYFGASFSKQNRGFASNARGSARHQRNFASHSAIAISDSRFRVCLPGCKRP